MSSFTSQTNHTGDTQEDIEPALIDSMHTDIQPMTPPTLSRSLTTTYNDYLLDGDVVAIAKPQLRRTYARSWGDIGDELDTVCRHILFDEPEPIDEPEPNEEYMNIATTIISNHTHGMNNMDMTNILNVMINNNVIRNNMNNDEIIIAVNTHLQNNINNLIDNNNNNINNLNDNINNTMT